MAFACCMSMKLFWLYFWCFGVFKLTCVICMLPPNLCFLAGFSGATKRMTTSMSVPVSLSSMNAQAGVNPMMVNQTMLSNYTSYQPGFVSIGRVEPFGEIAHCNVCSGIWKLIFNAFRVLFWTPIHCIKRLNHSQLKLASAFAILRCVNRYPPLAVINRLYMDTCQWTFKWFNSCTNLPPDCWL